jgi:hypothetical protein
MIKHEKNWTTSKADHLKANKIKSLLKHTHDLQQSINPAEMTIKMFANMEFYTFMIFCKLD